MAEHLPSMCKAVGLLLALQKKKKSPWFCGWCFFNLQGGQWLVVSIEPWVQAEFNYMGVLILFWRKFWYLGFIRNCWEPKVTVWPGHFGLEAFWQGQNLQVHHVSRGKGSSREKSHIHWAKFNAQTARLAGGKMAQQQIWARHGFYRRGRLRKLVHAW
jgi:hypothetical protein